jgi:adenylosuccinate synthase
MPVTVVVGGQYGSEGKGKVAHHWASARGAAAAIRVGGSNSGHTVVVDGRPLILRHLPTSAVLPDVLCVVAPGSYVDPAVFQKEVELLGLSPARVMVDARAIVVTERDREAERSALAEIGSTCSGTGAAVSRRINRVEGVEFAGQNTILGPYVRDTVPVLRALLGSDRRVIVEGTQGFGLSPIHSRYYPYVTSRDTTAAAAVAEAGLSPLDVDEVVLVIRAFPIRVAGPSGPFGSPETTWERISEMGGHAEQIAEFTSVTGKLRRVAEFDPAIVRDAILTNAPTTLVMNHLDYVDSRCRQLGPMSQKVASFVHQASIDIGRKIDVVGLGPDMLVARDAVAAA